MSIFRQLYNNNLVKKIGVVLRIIIPIAIFYYLFSIIKFDELKFSFLNSDKYYLTFALLFGFLSFTLQYIKWSNITGGLLGKYKISNIVKSLFAGYAYGLITPIRAGEIPGRKFGLTGSDITSVSMAVALDKSYNITAVLSIGSILFSIYVTFVTEYPLHVTIIIPLMVISILIGFYTLLKSDKLGSYPVLRNIRKIEYLNKIKLAFNRSRRMENTFHFRQYLLSVGIFLLYTIQFLFYVYAFESQGNLLIIYTGVGAIYYVKIFAGFLSIADLGIRESSAVYLLGMIGVGSAAALSASLLIFSTNILLPSLIGALIILRKS
ncbi:MAG: hypothetical protein SCALA702_12310 [Melioribacteraceae bacterium]|nr:MAG: hypothetical protein SCALA702_12310 [Melioribacteraceae bacterium]